MAVRSHHPNIREAHRDKFEQREIWYKLVVKVISWKDGLSDNGTIKLTDKITTKEWVTYTKRMISTNTTYGKEKVLSNLKDTRQLIQNHGGFEEKLI